MDEDITLKIIVQKTPACKKLLLYVDKNIGLINDAGAKVHIEVLNKEEIDKKTLEILDRKSITRLPALITPDGQSFVGIKRIIEVFENNISTNNKERKLGPITRAELGTNQDLSDYYADELYSRDDRGQRVVRQDGEEVEDLNGNKSDIDKKWQEYQRNIPRHRQVGSKNVTLPTENNTAGDNIGITADNGNNIGNNHNDMADYQENYADDADVDARMMNAWMNNIET